MTVPAVSLETAAPGGMDRESLSPSLLRHAGQGQRYLGFISYRRRDGIALARWLRDEILAFEAPPELAPRLAARDGEVEGRQNRVFLDLSYQRPSVDFWDEHIAASLCRSRTLILLQTPSVFEPLGPGEPNWCEREIETFLKFHGEPSRVLVVLGPGAPTDHFPAPLQKISGRWDWIDLRFFSTSMLMRQWNRADYDAQITKVLAKLYEVEDGDLPLLGRELQRARGLVRRRVGIAAAATILGLSGLTGWALIERSRAVEQRNAALISQSRYLARTADGLVDEGTTRAAIALLREALPDAARGRERPLVADVVASAYRAIFANKERGRLPVPVGALRVTSDGKAGLFVFATPEKLIVRQGLDGATDRVLAHDFGSPERLVLSPDGTKVVLIAADGHMSVRDIGTGRELVHHTGFGAGTVLEFVSGGRKGLVVAPERDVVALLDFDEAREITRRAFPAGRSPNTLLIDDDVIAIVHGQKLVRLSPDNIADMGSAAVDESAQFALALAHGRQDIVVAMSKGLLEGRFAVVRLADMTLTRTFGKIVWGAKAMSISRDKHVIALHGINGVDFFELESGERTSHVASRFTITGGRFVGTHYMGFGANGAISRWNYVLGTEVDSYTTVDTSAITALDPLPDESGFITLSDRPALVHWAFEARMISRKFAVPLIINGVDFKFDQPLVAFDKRVGIDATDVVAAYVDGSLRRWDLLAGEAKIILPAGKRAGGAELQKLVALAGKVVLLDAQGGANIIGDDGRGTGQLTVGPVRYAAGLDETKAAFVMQGGAVKVLDVAGPEPRLEDVPDLKGCEQAMTVPGTIICALGDGQLRLWSPGRGRAFSVAARQASSLAAASVSANARHLAVASRDGHLVVIDTAGWTEVLSVDLRSEDNSEAEPVRLAISADGEQIAAAFSNGKICVLDVRSGQQHDIAGHRPGVGFVALEFSVHGKLVAAVEIRDVAVLAVMDASGGPRLASISLSGEPRPTLFPEPRGRGFVTVDAGGRILVHPAFERPDDLVDYLKREFPDELTPAQRRKFFID